MEIINFKEQPKLSIEQFSEGINNLLEKVEKGVTLGQCIGALEIIKYNCIKSLEESSNELK